MRKRLVPVAAPMCVFALAIAASVSVAYPSDAESSAMTLLDELDRARPAAAVSTGSAVSLEALAVGSAARFGAFAAWLRQTQLREYLDAAAAVPPAAPQWHGGGGVLACIRERESHGDYAARNTGSGAAGAYQFLPGTWDSTAARAGRADLVGVDPASASAADQDAMAGQLYEEQGAAPWGGSC